MRSDRCFIFFFTKISINLLYGVYFILFLWYDVIMNPQRVLIIILEDFMKEKTCAIVDNNNCSGIDIIQLESKIIKLINMGITNFLYGNTCGTFESLCVETVQKLENIYPNVNCSILRRCAMTKNAAYALCYIDCLHDKEVRIFDYDHLRRCRLMGAGQTDSYPSTPGSTCPSKLNSPGARIKRRSLSSGSVSPARRILILASQIKIALIPSELKISGLSLLYSPKG